MNVYEKATRISRWLLGFVDLRELLVYLQRAGKCAVKAAWRNAITPQGIQVPYEPLGLSMTGHLVV
jgi:hypothetical protein